MAFGPTQNYDDASLGMWRPRPVIAGLLRVLIAVVPVIAALAFGWAMTTWLPPSRLGVSLWLWLVIEIACCAALIIVLGRSLRRLLPVSTLLRLSLLFPDRAPSRLAVARRTYSPTALRLRMESARTRSAEVDPDDRHALRLLDLVAALNSHDRTTFRHSERVQAYAALIGAELGLSRYDAARLSWAALLHDVGKLQVPREVLDKPGRPSPQEWTVLACHPEEGARIAAPLTGWLGPWSEAIVQHHERWDGGGYPAGLAGEQISLGARIVAVADAYDVITSTRSYKRPLPAAAARAELARCAGTQFDPDVIRAFLAVGLGGLRVVAGPGAFLSALPALRLVPLPDVVGTVTRVVAVAPPAPAVATAAVLAAGLVVGAPGVGLDATAPQGGVTSVADAGVRGGSVPPGAPGGTPVDRGPASERDRAVEDADADDRPGEGDVIAAASTLPPGDRAEGTSGEGTGGEGTSGGRAGPSLPDLVRTPADASSVDAPPLDAPSTDTESTDKASKDKASKDKDVTKAPVPTASPSGSEARTTAPTGACATAAAGRPVEPRAILVNCDLRGAHLTGSFAGADLSGADLTGATLSDVDLTGANLSGARLVRARISGTTFDGARLTGAAFTGAVITRSSFTGAIMTSTTLAGATVTDSRID